jgi:adenylyltransferase/sulfurtransferase
MSMDADRYDRQRRIDGWDQAALLRARVLVAGAGALGNELLKNLVLLGVGHLLVVDFDQIEHSNLSRTVLFRESDVGRAKARAAVEAAAHLNPDVNLRALEGDLFYDVGLGLYRHCDLVVGGLDNLAARSQVGVSCALAGVPFLDGGMWALGGEVRWFMADEGPCFDCTLSDADRERAHERRSCTGLRLEDADPYQRHVPTTVSTAAVIGGLLAQETARYLCGWDVHVGQAAVYNGLSLTMHRTTLSRDPDCPNHTPYRDVIELDAGAADLTGHALLERARADLGASAIVELGRDVLLDFHCPHCGRVEAVNAPLGRVDVERARCPHCEATREAHILSHLDDNTAEAERSLSALGVPPGEILAVRTEQAERLQLYELTADVNDLWS